MITTMNERMFPPVRASHPHVVEHPVFGMVVSGTRVPVRNLWRWHRRGVSVDTLFKRYPSIARAKILSALSFAHDNEERIEAELSHERAILSGGDTMTPSDRSDVATFFAWL